MDAARVAWSRDDEAACWDETPTPSGVVPTSGTRARYLQARSWRDDEPAIEVRELWPSEAAAIALLELAEADDEAVTGIAAIDIEIEFEQAEIGYDELVAYDALSAANECDEDDTPTCELVAPRIGPNQIAPELIDAWIALELEGHGLRSPHRFGDALLETWLRK